MIRDSLEAVGGKAKWIPHEKNPADCMTKLKGNAACLVEFMRKAKFRMVDVGEEMEARKQYREATGKKNPRPKVSIATKKVKGKKNRPYALDSQRIDDICNSTSTSMFVYTQKAGAPKDSKKTSSSTSSKESLSSGIATVAISAQSSTSKEDDSNDKDDQAMSSEGAAKEKKARKAFEKRAADRWAATTLDENFMRLKVDR